MIEQYDEVHRNIWPEMIASLEDMGVRDYSIFRRGQDLMLVLTVANFDDFINGMAASEVDRRWQKQMEPFWESVPGQRPDEKFVMWQEVFYMEGKQ